MLPTPQYSARRERGLGVLYVQCRYTVCVGVLLHVGKVTAWLLVACAVRPGNALALRTVVAGRCDGMSLRHVVVFVVVVLAAKSRFAFAYVRLKASFVVNAR